MDFQRNLNLRIGAEFTPQAQRVVQQIGGLLTGQGQNGTGTSGGGSNEGSISRVAEDTARAAEAQATLGQKVANVWKNVQYGIAKAYQWSRRFLLGVSIAMYALQMVTRPIDDLLKRVEQLGQRALQTFEGWGKAALKAASDMQNLQLRTMAIFGSEGASGFDWLTKFTVGMPFQIKQLGEAFNMLGVYGTSSLVNIKQAMKDVADTAAALEREPKDVAMGLALGAEGAQGGLRRLRQMGITPRELIAQGAVANKAGTGLDNDPASFAKNAAAIMAVMEQKFGGIASAMRGSWAQMLLDMQDYWLRFTLMLSHGQGFGVLSGFLGGIRDKVAAAFDDGRAQKFADSIGAILVNLRPIGNLLLQMVDPAIDRIAAGAQVIADKIKAWMDAGKLQDFLNKALTAAAKFVPLAVQVGNFYIQLKLWSYDLRLVLGQVVAWVDVLWNKIAQGFAALRGHKAEAAGYGKAASAAEASSADFGKMRQQLVKGATIAQDYLNKGGNWTLKQIEDAQAALKNVKWSDDLQGMVKDWSSALGRAAASIRQGYKDGGEEAEESGTKAGENFADAAGKGMDKWLGGAGILDVGNFLANMKHGMSPDAAMAATKARSDAEHPSKKDSYYGTVTGVPFAKWPASAAQPTGDGGGGAPTTDAWAAQQAANEANSKRLNSQWNDAHSADPYRGMGAGEAARLGQDMNGGAGGDASSPASGGGHPNAKYWGIGGGLLAAWRVLTNLKNAVVRKLNPNASKTVEGYFKDWLLRRRGGSSGSAGEGAEAAAASSRNFAGDAAWMEQQANARRVLTGGEGGGQSAYDMNRLADLGRKRGMGRGIRGGPSGTGAEVEATETVSRFLPRILEWAGKLFKSDTSAMGMLDWGRAMDEFNKHYKGPRGFGPITPDMTFPKLLALGERQLAVLNGIYGLQHANYTGAHNAPAHSMMTVTPHTIPQTYAPRPVSQAAFTGGGNGVTHIHCTVHGVVTPQAIGHALQAALPGAFQRHDENTARAIYQ